MGESSSTVAGCGVHKLDPEGGCLQPSRNKRMAPGPELDYFSPLGLKICNKSIALLHPD